MIYKTIHTKIKDRGTRTPLNTWDEHGYYSVNDAPTLSIGDTKHVRWTRILFCQRRTNIVHGRYSTRGVNTDIILSTTHQHRPWEILNTWGEHGYYSVNDAPTSSMGDTQHVGWTRKLFCQRRTNIVHGRYPSEQHWEPVIVKHKKSVRYKKYNTQLHVM